MNLLMTTLAAVVTSAGFWACLQLIITRKGRTAEIARQKAETEKIQQEAASGDARCWTKLRSQARRPP
jgi:hypothetical protein